VAALVSADARAFAGSRDMQSHYSDVRQRLHAGAPPAPRQCVEADLVPAPAPKIERPRVPFELDSVVDAVACALCLEPLAMLAGEDTRSIMGRDLVAALGVRRCLMSRRTVAHILGLTERDVARSVEALNRCLSILQASAVYADLAGLAVRLVELFAAAETRQAHPHVAEIQRAVCDAYHLGMIDMKCARRTANLVRPRQIAMYLAKRLTLRSYPEIGRAFGGRDHTTVLHAFHKIDHLLAARGVRVDESATLAENVAVVAAALA
jgi:chromosomal replication initiator protein